MGMAAGNTGRTTTAGGRGGRSAAAAKPKPTGNAKPKAAAAAAAKATRATAGDGKPKAAAAATARATRTTAGNGRSKNATAANAKLARAAAANATVQQAASFAQDPSYVAPPAPPFSLAVGAPTSSAWREQALARVAELRSLTAWVGAQDGVDPRTAPALQASINAHLDAAEAAAKGDGIRSWWTRRAAWVSGAEVERAMSNTEAAEADLVRMAPLWLLRGAMPSLLVTVTKHLESPDARRTRLEEIARKAEDKDLDDRDREVIVRAVRGATSEGRRVVSRVRSFRNVLLVTAGILAVVVVVLGLIVANHPTALPICFAPDNTKVVCPTGETALPPLATGANDPRPGEIDRATARAVNDGDIWLILGLGTVAAAVAAAAALRSIRGTSTPYSLPVALALLKLPTGALTALLGLLLMRGNFVPGLSALDTSAQIVAWAIIFGYAQQLFTRLVDRQAHAVLDDVGNSNQSKTS
jgi:hypothetical protein